jgi:16S rRNA (guanine527-N7)-methyltransferase
VPVSRETASPDPSVVAALFPGREAEIYRYVDLLANAGVDRGLIGPREAPRLWDRHIINSAVIRDIFAPATSLADVGAGAGLPGVVLAISRPDLQITLIEPLLRRCAFLSEVVADIGLANTEVLRGRAEELGGKRLFDNVTARAVAPLTRLVPWCLPLCRSGGELVALKGGSAADEVEGAAAVLAEYAAGPARIETWGAGMASTPTTVVRIQSSGHHPSARRGTR